MVLTILLVRGLTLEGSTEGIIHYIKPNFTNMLKAEVGAFLFLSTRAAAVMNIVIMALSL